jgi:RimJ/RimL family protein N-acetyltransferase
MSTPSPIPELLTDRLHLRAPKLNDFSPFAEFYGDAAASAFYGGPLTATGTWNKLCAEVGHWTLRGHGKWAVESQDTGAFVGICGLELAEGWPCPELTWWMLPTHRRKGFAQEASRAAIRFGYDTLGWAQVRTYTKDDNHAARALIAKLGGERTDRQVFPDGIARDIFVLPKPA